MRVAARNALFNGLPSKLHNFALASVVDLRWIAPSPLVPVDHPQRGSRLSEPCGKYGLMGDHGRVKPWVRTPNRGPIG